MWRVIPAARRKIKLLANWVFAVDVFSALENEEGQIR